MMETVQISIRDPLMHQYPEVRTALGLNSHHDSLGGGSVHTILEDPVQLWACHGDLDPPKHLRTPTD